MSEVRVHRPAGLSALSWIHWAILLVSVGLTVSGYEYSRRLADERRATRFDRQASQLVELVRERMQTYEDALRGGASAVHALGGDATHAQWRAFAETLQVERRYPGINGIGVIHRVPAADMERYLAEQRSQRPGYALHPRVDGPEHWPITYIEPEASNRRAVGLDTSHEPNRLAAIRASRDTGLAHITAPIVLVQDEKRTPGFLFFVPYYNGPAATLEQRRASIGGLVYAPFVVERLLHGTLERDQRHVEVRISDAEVVLYDEFATRDSAFDPDALYETVRDVEMFGRVWRFDLRSDRSFRQATLDTQPLTLLLGGAVIDVLLLAVFLAMARSARRAVRYADAATVELRARQLELETSNATLRDQARALELAKHEAEQAKEVAETATAAKSTFLATMSHELRTPMNGVIATAELLLDASPDERRQLTETIIRSGQTLLALLNDILDFSKLEAGKVTLDLQPAQLRFLMSETLQLLEPHREANGVAVRQCVEEGVPEWLSVDSLRLRQILLNLCSNAIKFSAGGEVELSCRVLGRRDDTFHLEFSVKDTGIGIADPSALFQEFSQADASTTRKYGGTGLGLAICKRLVERMGGAIGVESILGKGATFRFDLHLEAAPRPIAIVENSGAGLPPRSTGVALVVDDNEVNRMVARKLLERAGWTVELACDGYQAIELVSAQRFELIFMDCQMPGMDGYQTTVELHKRHPQLAPVIALTANTSEEDRERCAQAGMVDFVTKPLRAKALESVLERWSAFVYSERRPPASSVEGRSNAPAPLSS